MRTLLYIVTLLFILTSDLFSQSYRLEPLTSDLLCVQTRDSLIVVCGTNGILLLSEDAGSNWKQMYIPENRIITDVTIGKNNATFVVLTDNSTGYLTATKGVTWEKFHTPDGSHSILCLGDTTLLCTDNAGKLYNKRLGTSDDWQEFYSATKPIIDIADAGKDSLIFYTEDTLYLATNNRTTIQSILPLSFASLGIITRFHHTSDNRWGFGNGQVLYYSGSNVSEWNRFALDTTADYLMVEPGMKATAFYRNRYHPDSFRGAMYSVSTYNIAANTWLSNVNLDSSFSPRLIPKFFPDAPATVFTSIPSITSGQLVNGNQIIVIGIDKMMYMQSSNGTWNQLSLMTDMPSRTIFGDTLPTTYQFMGTCFKAITYGTYTGILFAQSLNNGVTWKTPRTDWTEFMNDNTNYDYYLKLSCSNGTALILSSQLRKNIFFRSSDSLQSFSRLTTDFISPTNTMFPSSSSLKYLGDKSWFFTNSFRKDSIAKGFENNISSVFGYSYDNGTSWKFTFLDSILSGKAYFFTNNQLLLPIKFPDSVYKGADGYTLRKSGGCELWKSSDTLRTHEVIPQKGLHSIESIHMFNELHGAGFIVYSLENDIQKGAIAETFDGGRSWVKIDTSKYIGNFQPVTSSTPDGSSYMISEGSYTKLGVPNPLYIWRNHGKDRITITVPTDHSSSILIAKDTILYTVPGELYRLVIEPTLSVDDSKIEDYETSVFLQTPYPNPASSKVRIPIWYYTQTVRQQDISVVCYTVLGTKVTDLTNSLTHVTNEQSYADWDMSGLPSGIYVIKALTTSGKGSTRIVVKN